MSHTIVRQAEASDLLKILAYTLKLHQHEDDGQLKNNSLFEANLKRWLTNELNNPLSLFLIAESNEKAIGFIGATTVINDNGFLDDPTKGLIQLLWVEERYRKQHVAQKLLAEVENCFKHSGVNYVEANYTSTNKLAESFWGKCGYLQSSITVRKFL